MFAERITVRFTTEHGVIACVTGDIMRNRNWAGKPQALSANPGPGSEY